MSRSAAVASRRPDRRPAQTIRKLLDAGAAELRAAPYSALSMRSVAARAEVSPASAYTYFPSKNALVANLYLDTLKTVALQPDNSESPKRRVNAVMRGMLLAGADQPGLTAACATAMLADEPAVETARAEIAQEFARRIRSALGPGWRPDVAATLGLTFAGALMSARFLTHDQTARQLESAVDLVLGASVS